MPDQDTPSKSLALEDLVGRFPHIPPECGTALVQSAVLCLLKVRITQTERSDPSGLTAYIAVVEFGAPRAKVVRR
jgi:hypothetical protein